MPLLLGGTSGCPPKGPVLSSPRFTSEAFGMSALNKAPSSSQQAYLVVQRLVELEVLGLQGGLLAQELLFQVVMAFLHARSATRLSMKQAPFSWGA